MELQKLLGQGFFVAYLKKTPRGHQARISVTLCWLEIIMWPKRFLWKKSLIGQRERLLISCVTLWSKGLITGRNNNVFFVVCLLFMISSASVNIVDVVLMIIVSSHRRVTCYTLYSKWRSNFEKKNQTNHILISFLVIVFWQFDVSFICSIYHSLT